MKIPGRIEIAGVEYEIIWKWNLRDDRGEPLWGACDRDNPILYLNRSLADDEREVTFIHECFHGVLSELRKSKRLSVKDLSYAKEEMIVEEMAQFIVSAFKLRLKR